uniref:Uncharacterized protein n=1 Tax=Anguilla anguilla TaxID=7936 RepID=A0A0E9V157_ANGAN
MANAGNACDLSTKKFRHVFECTRLKLMLIK